MCESREGIWVNCNAGRMLEVARRAWCGQLGSAHKAKSSRAGDAQPPYRTAVALRTHWPPACRCGGVEAVARLIRLVMIAEGATSVYPYMDRHFASVFTTPGAYLRNSASNPPTRHLASHPPTVTHRGHLSKPHNTTRRLSVASNSFPSPSTSTWTHARTRRSPSPIAAIVHSDPSAAELKFAHRESRLGS